MMFAADMQIPRLFPFLSALLLILSVGSLRSQTIVTTQDGLEVEGRIISRGVDSLTVVTAEGRRVRIGNLQVRSITEREPLLPPAPPPPPPGCTDCPMLGGVIFDPAGVNLIAGFRVGPLGVRMTGLYLGRDNFGGQFDFLMNMEDDGRFIHDLYLGIGISSNTDYAGLTIRGRDSWRYAVVGYDVSYIGMYANVGLSFGKGELSNRLVNLLFQLGFVKQVR